MNILELKVAFDDVLAQTNEQGYEIKDKELVALVDNSIRNEDPPREKFEQADLIFDTVEARRLPTGASFVVIKCIKRPNQNVALERIIESLNEAMNTVPLNAPVIFQYNGEMILLWCICTIICSDDHQEFSRTVVQFADKGFPGYLTVCIKIMESLGISSKGDQKRYRLF